MYIVARGTVTVYKYNERLKQNEQVILKEGDYFGEIAVLLKTSRKATVISTNFSTLAVLLKEDLEDVLR
jgi:CRP-like cAMP-binding protein